MNMRTREEIGREFAKLGDGLDQSFLREKLMLEVLSDIKELLVEQAAREVNLKTKKG